MPPLGWSASANQFDFRLSAAANADPVTVTEPPVPVRVSSLTRPPKSPSPLRAVTSSEVKVPMTG